jgi:hypothetical protein
MVGIIMMAILQPLKKIMILRKGSRFILEKKSAKGYSALLEEMLNSLKDMTSSTTLFSSVSSKDQIVRVISATIAIWNLAFYVKTMTTKIYHCMQTDNLRFIYQLSLSKISKVIYLVSSTSSHYTSKKYDI